MSSTDFFSIIQWSLTIFFVGLPFVPFTSNLFSSFFDRGYIFAKILGIAIASYSTFILGIFHVLPFSQYTILLTLFVLTFIFNINNIVKKNSGVLALLREKKYIFMLEEMLFFLGLLFWCWIRSYSPDIHGLEKFMDYGFINSLLRADYFPPKDMWFTPFTINYYYFGHVITAVLTKLSGLPSHITFNIMVATIFSLCLTASFSIGGNLYTLLVKERFSLTKFAISGILSGILVTFSGNVHVLYAFFSSYDVSHPRPFWQMIFSPQTFPNAYWYPNATRFIYNTIHEFPMYSWVVSDLHGHVLDIPFVLFTIALLLAIFLQPTQLEPRNKKITNKFVHVLLDLVYKKEILVGLILAIMYMTNAWDGIIYLLLASIIYTCKAFIPNNHFTKFHLKELFNSERIQNLLTSLITLFVSFVIFSLPFSYFFKPFVSGIGILSAPNFLISLGKIGPFLFEANHNQHSPWWQLLILYGFFLFFITSYIVFLSFTKQKRKVDIFVIALILLSLILIVIPELVYVKDIYPEHYRANTMFKLVFQAFIILSLVSGFVITRILVSLKRTVFQKLLFFAFFFITSLLLITVLTYPYFAVTSYYNNLQKKHSLDGTAYIKNTYPEDFEAIAWLQKNIAGQPVILEAQGDSYTDYARISSNTGLPTVLGWTVHEWLWRGTYDIPAPRIDDIKNMYEMTDIIKTKALLRKYAVQYVYIGDLEHQKYQVNEEKLKTLGKIVFKKNLTTIIKISP